ncbi:MAG: stage II sporulation protein P [Acetobacteraceae bacterium]|nr:stage II sporulation protein P [Acetobacteraceae bacterium]
MTSARRTAGRRPGPLWGALLALWVAGGGLFAAPAWAHTEVGRGWYTLLDTSGKVLLRTGLVITPGDSFVDRDDREYTVFQVVGTVAYGRRADGGSQAASESQGAEAVAGEALAPAGAARPTVAIYHTHSDESFLPSDGTGSIPGRGSIFEVGRELKLSLEKQGIRALQSRVSHDPHDAAAYDRSRRTARELLSSARPAMLLDVHRDTAPVEVYRRNIEGQQVAEILLVVGRQNPNQGANAAFARRLKSTLDQRVPGLVRGIFFAQGDYNQDLHPRALLLEVGTYLLPREEAERSMRLFAQGVTPLLGAAGATGRGAAAESRSAWLTLLWVALVLGGGVAGYLYISTGSWQEAGRKVVRFFRHDLGSILARVRRPAGGGRS